MDTKILSGLQGAWKSQGYGWIMEITGEQVKYFDHCRVGRIEMSPDSVPPIHFSQGKLEKPDPARFILHPKGSVMQYTFERIDKLPPQVEPAKRQDAVINFEFFWHYFNENYAFFKLRKTDWGQVYQEFRPRVNSNTSPAELRGIFTEILQKLGDMHVTLDAGEHHVESAQPTRLHLQWKKEFKAENEHEFLMKGFGRISEMITKDILKGQFKKAANDLVCWGKLPGNIGYFFAALMYGFAGFENNNVDEHLQVITETMDAVMEDLKNTDGMILDMRFNHGGLDPAAQIIANHFADQERLAFTKQAVYGEGLTERYPVYVHPARKHPYTRPVALLISESSISAAEVFTLFMMPLPHVVRIGETTQGVFSDVLGKTLPNGWRVGLSNEIYTAADGKVYEGVGIPAEVKVPVYDEEHFYQRLVAMVAEAADYLKGKVAQ